MNALAMLARCAQHQPEDALHAGRELVDVYSGEAQPAESETALPDPERRPDENPE